MENDLKISVNGFGENYKKQAILLGEITLEIIRCIESEYQLDISKLKNVNISFDFQGALQEVSNEFGHEFPATYTNNDFAKAIAQLKSRLGDNGKLSEYTLVLSVDFFMELFDENYEISSSNASHIIHRLHHELVHIHELNKNNLDSSKLIDGYDDIFLMTVKRTWSEYLANNMSSFTATDDSVIGMFNTFEKILNHYPSEIEGLIDNYKYGSLSLSEMHTSVTERIKTISIMYGYVYGYIQGLNIDVEDSFPDLFSLLLSSKLTPSLNMLGEELSDIKCKFEDGGLFNYSDFDSATKVIHSIYASFGLQVDRNIDPKNGLYIHVY